MSFRRPFRRRAWSRADARRRLDGIRSLRLWVAGCGMIWLCYVLSTYSFEGSLRVGHMSFRQRAGDAYWVARSYSQQWRTPVVASERWTRNVSGARCCCLSQSPRLLMHLKVPKAASTTIFDILYSLAPRNRFAVNSRPFYIDETRPRRAASEFVEYLDSLEKRTAHTAHGPYMDFRISSLQQERLPAYVALVRDPVKRLESHYNYLHWGPRSAWAKFWKGQDTSAPSFQSCVEDAAVLTGGEGEKLLSLPRSRRESKGDCLYWANAQLAYFCGLNCNHLDITYRRAGNHSLKKALANIERDFVAVGLVEDIDHSLRLFQSLLPSFFDGAPERGGGLVARATKPQAATGTTSSPGNKSIHTFLADAVMPHEYGLYDEVKRKFQGQLVACGLSSR